MELVCSFICYFPRKMKHLLYCTVQWASLSISQYLVLSANIPCFQSSW